MNITQAHIKYYGTLAATVFVLMLSADHIAAALNVVEKIQMSQDNIFLSGVWFAAAGLQVFEVLTGMGVADMVTRRNKNNLVISFLVGILVFFFLINLSGNMLYAITNMAEKTGREMTWDMVKNLDALKITWVLWAAIPIPLMGLAGITVMTIFKKDLPKKVKQADVKPEKPQVRPTAAPAPDFAPVYDPDAPEKQSQPGE